MTGLTPPLCQPKSSLRSCAQRQEGAATQPQEGWLGRHQETREGFGEFRPNHKATAGRRREKEKMKVMLRAKGQILFCRGNCGTRRKCRLIKNGLC